MNTWVYTRKKYYNTTLSMENYDQIRQYISYILIIKTNQYINIIALITDKCEKLIYKTSLQLVDCLCFWDLPEGLS